MMVILKNDIKKIGYCRFGSSSQVKEYTLKLEQFGTYTPHRIYSPLQLEKYYKTNKKVR